MNSSAADAKRWTIVAGVILVGGGILREAVVNQGLPGRDFWIGSSIAMFMLSMMADMRPNETGPFALLIITAGIYSNSEPVLRKLSELQGTAKRPPPRVRRNK
jgi:hypothetical protein